MLRRGFVASGSSGISAELISEHCPELVERVWLNQRNCAAFQCVIQNRRHADLATSPDVQHRSAGAVLRGRSGRSQESDGARPFAYCCNRRSRFSLRAVTAASTSSSSERAAAHLDSYPTRGIGESLPLSSVICTLPSTTYRSSGRMTPKIV